MMENTTGGATASNGAGGNAKGNVLRQLPQYECHKIVGALKIKDIQVGDEESELLVEEAGYTPILVTNEWMSKHQPMVGGYYVVYMDGYASFSPEKVFDDGYTLIK